MARTLSAAFAGFFLTIAALSPAIAQEVTVSPSSLKFASTYVGKTTSAQVITVTNVSSGTVIIESIAFSCPGYGISSGVAPTSLYKTGNITHYSIFFQPEAAQAYDCNFVMTLQDNSVVNVPLTATGLTSTATASISPASLTFANRAVGSSSASQTFTITNTGTSSIKLNVITISPPDFTSGKVTLPYTIAAGKNLPVTVFYSPSHVTSENGAVDLTFDKIPDTGVSLTGNGVAAASLSIATFATLPQATQSAAYLATLATSGGKSPFTWSLASGSTLPSGLTLSSAGVISGTLASSVGVGAHTFIVQVKDSTNKTVSKTFTLSAYANLKDNCNDLTYDVPGTTTPIVALTDLGTGTYQGEEGGLYPNGSNVRPEPHDSDGIAFADAIQPLDSNGNPSPTGKYVLLAIGESTAQNEFNRFLPIANADPAKNASLVIVNGAQGGATPNQLVTSSSYYWSTIVNNYLPQNNVTSEQVVAAWIEDSDAISSGSFPTDMTSMQAEYETLMQDLLVKFPNVKLVYWSSRVYAGYSNGVGKPDNPEPYAYEAGFATKNAIGDQIDGAPNLNYNPANGPVLAPWMAWGPYYWSNGMLGREDGLVWDCEDFSSDGTHPSSTFGQLKVATELLNFLKTDDTTTPWYLAH
ncbi:MAG: choice-of-anchor D domain-containing protein [Candidatus Sulfotelmatobacter sp.]